MSEESKGVDSRNNIYYYGAFGKMKEAYSLEKNSRLNYINKAQDLESGLRDHGVRKYDEDIGRFTSVDPLWSKYIGWTPYHYCGNDPVNASDGNGLDIEYDVNGSPVCKIQTSKINQSYNVNSKNLSVPKNFNPLSIPYDKIEKAMNDPKAVGIGLQLSGEFTAIMGAGASFTMIDFTKGQDKNNGVFGYFSFSGKVGVNVGASAQMVECESDEPEGSINRNSPVGKSGSVGISFGSLSLSASYSIKQNANNPVDIINSLFSTSHSFYTKGIGIGVGAPVGASIGFDVTTQPSKLSNVDLFHK